MINFKKLLVLLFLIVVFLSAASAEETDAFETYPDALGGYYGEIGGTGLSYQHWFDKIGIQTALGIFYYPDDMIEYATSPVYNADSYDVDIFVYNIGIEVQYMVYQDSFRDWFDGNLYVFAGGMHDGRIRTTYTFEERVYNEDSDNEYTDYPKTGESAPFYVPIFSVGFGFGFETVLFNHFSLPFEFGLMGAWELGTAMPVDAGLKIQGGLRYRF